MDGEMRRGDAAAAAAAAGDMGLRMDGRCSRLECTDGDSMVTGL